MNQKYTFLWALILTLAVFNIGIFLGYQLELSRINKINEWYIKTDLNLLDQRVQSDASSIVGFECDDLIKENINFADIVYNEAQKIQKYDDANRISLDIIIQHKKFDLLRALFWMNSIKIKQKCNNSFRTVVYIYDYDNPSIEQQAKQHFFSNLLMELKQKYGDKIILIPIAGDNNLPSINLLIQKYNITEFPTIFIDENIKITEVKDINDIMRYLD